MNRFILALGTVAHLLPHPFGVSPVGAMALYAGANGPARFSWLVPLLPLGLAAVLFGFYDPLIMAMVYAGFALAAVVGRALLASGRNYARFATAISAGAIVFFLLSNFAVWLAGYYPPTAAGLAQCYINGLPYLGVAVLADAAYCFLLFGLHSAIERQAAVAAHA